MNFSSFRPRASLIALLLLMLTAPGIARADQKTIRWKEGVWRLEASSFTGIRSGRRSRTGDLAVNATIEYEVPAGNRSTTGIRLHPLFYYKEDLTDKDIWGVAVGPTIRVYQDKQFRRGVFGELEGSVLWQSDEFRGNKSRTNFILEVGAGYKFESDWHVTLKGRHISNAGIASSNSGVNGLGLALGYTF